ncbi:methionyl-tRNA formyltransferase [Christiangramia flava]|nr:methionyl-tRNA formyltransferase [Christiangramia flava]
MKNLRILFMGTPDFAVQSLDAILKEKMNVVGVVTAPDRPAGRGRKINESAVKTYASKHGLNILQPTNLKSEEFLEELKSLDIDVSVVVAFRMLPESVWKLPKYGTFNLHASLLPQYRGAAPINWAVINGEKKTGVTTFFIDEKIDTGNIILQKETKIHPEETVGELHDRLQEIGAGLVVKTLQQIAKNKLETQQQKETGELLPAPKLNPENTKIDWNDTVDHIYNHIRGLNPYPGAWCYLENSTDELRVKIFGVGKMYQEHHSPAGSVNVNAQQIKVAAKNGYVIVKEIQLPGKRKMDSKSLLNGFNFASDAKMR